MRAGLTYLLLGAVAIAVAGKLDDWRAIEDSLRTVPPKFRETWLRERGIEWPGYTAGPAVDSGLTLVGKWGRGPSVEVTGRDTLVVLTLGSEVALLSFADPDEPRELSEIQFSSMTGQSQLVGSRLYVSSGRTFEAWDVTDAASPTRLGSLSYGIGDFQVNDTLLYFLRLDTFRVFSVADPGNMRQLGACRDSGYFLAATESTVVLGHSRRGLYLIDVTDPASPQRVGSHPSDQPLSAVARNNLVCVTLRSGTEPYPIRFVTIDISNPASPYQLGILNNAGGYDLHLDGPLAFASGRDLLNEPFQVVSIADSAHPAVIGQCRTTDYYNWGVWANTSRDRAYVANSGDGLAVLDIASLSNPRRDKSLLGAGITVDLEVRRNRCFAAGLAGGLKIIDVTDPATPLTLGEVDSLGGEQTCYSVAVDDSFAYGGWFNTPFFRVADVSDPTRPEFIGWCDPFEYAQDMVLRDTLIYAADHYRFEVINVARPREPEVVGTCELQNMSTCLFVSETLAYVGNWPTAIISVSDPAHPAVVGGFDLPAGGVAVRDTFAYIAGTYDSFFVYSVADPMQPVRLGSLDLSGGIPYGQWNSGLVQVDTVVYVGGWLLKSVSVADPARPREIAPRWQPPSRAVKRLEHAAPYLYAACSDGGVCILETLQTGITESRVLTPRPSALRAVPSVTASAVSLELPVGSEGHWSLYDAAGREVDAARLRRAVHESSGRLVLDLSSLPVGAYVIRVEAGSRAFTTRVVRTGRR